MMLTHQHQQTEEMKSANTPQKVTCEGGGLLPMLIAGRRERLEHITSPLYKLPQGTK
jgi:hypothetical protein